VAGIITGGGITLYVKHEAPQAPPDAASVQDSRSAIPERELADVAEAVETLERRLAGLMRQQSDMAMRFATQPPDATTLVTAESAMSQEDADSAYAQARESAISSVMDREAPDSSASARIADQVVTTFAAASLAGHLVSAVGCRTTVCRVDVQHERGFDAGEALTAMQQALITESEGTIEGFYRTIAHADGSSTTRLYVTNGVESLPASAP
jgi:hypothetical protein